MTEPVAYRAKDKDEMAYYLTSEYPDGRWDIIQPLYTDEQLHPRVKMTQAEFETFKNIKQKNNLLSDALNSTAFFGDEKQQSEKQIEFANLFINLDLNNPDETIEIVPDMKWFVRTKKLAENSKYLWLCDAEYLNVPQCMFTNDNQLTAMRFDTKEEAERWTNPLTEAVQLPVEGQ